MKYIIAASIILGMVIGSLTVYLLSPQRVETIEHCTPWQQKEENARAACIELGGVPISNTFGGVGRCDFPHE